MILLHFLLFFTILLPVLSTYDRSQALSRFNEARARMLSNRAKLRANSVRLANHGRSSMPNRSKRQYASENVNGPYPYVPPPQPAVNQNFAYEDPAPELIHICSIEDDEYARSAESEEDFHPFDGDGEETLSTVPGMRSGFPRMHFDSFPKTREGRRESENFELHGKARAMGNQWVDESQAERPLNRALEELSDVRDILNRFEADSLREAEDMEVTTEGAPSEALPTGEGATGTGPSDTGTSTARPAGDLKVPSPWSPIPKGTAGQRGGIKTIKTDPGIKATEKGSIVSHTVQGGEGSDPRDADAHIHSRFHNHQHSIVHSHGKLPLSPTYYGTSSFPLPQTHVVTPGLNLNINQNQNLHSGLHQPSISHTSLFNHGIGPSISHSLPSQSAVISTQTQPGFHARHSGVTPQNHALSQEVNQNLHPNSVHNYGQAQNIHPVGPDGRPHLNNIGLVNQDSHHGSFRFGEETLGAAEDLTEENMSSWPNERKASPTHKKKFKKMKPQYYQAYPSYGSYYQHYGPNFGSYREAGEEEDNLGWVREASPTHHKKTHKMSHYPSRYREAEENEHVSPEDLVSSVFEEREASPTHEKKQKFTTVYYPDYNRQPQYYSQSGHYREADENEDEASAFPLSEDREASPTHHKKKNKFTPIYTPQPHYYPQSGHYREAEDNDEQRRQGDDSDDLEDLISSSFLFDFPDRRRISEYKKRSTDELDEILGEQRQIVDSLQNQSKNDEDLKLIADISNRTLTDLEEKRKKITKRSIPLTRLISDPRVKLDVPQTVENFGTATKNAFEDERAPMYHLKHMIGSSKNAILSAMRIPPQNMILPSDYEIVKTSERVGDARSDSLDDDHPFSHTFKKVGQMLRNGIESGQETAAHIGEAAYSAKNVLNTARHSAPRLIIPYSQIPAIQDTRRKRPNKAILVTPRILDLAEETSLRKASDSRPNFVRLGHLMDALGLSKPNSKNLELQKIIFEPRGISEARVDERLAQLYGKFRNNYDDDVDTVSEAIGTLEDAKISVGAKNLRDFLVKMRGELTNMVRGAPIEHKKKKPTYKKKKQQETREMGHFIETLFDGSKEQSKNGEATGEAKNGEGENDVVGDRMFLSPELLHPFMGRASKTDLKNFLRDNGDENFDKLINTVEYKKEDVSRNDNEELTRSSHDEHNNSDLGYVLGAINPLMFERLYNQTVNINKDGLINPEELFQHQVKKEEPDGNGTLGTSFALTGPMLKPFMGDVRPQQIERFLDTYNTDADSKFEEDDE